MPDRSTGRVLTGLAAVAVVALALFAWRPVVADDSFMYAATGRYVVDHHEVPHTDPLSWTAAGQPWQSNGWLFGVIASEAQSVGGPAGLAFLVPLLVGLTAVAAAFAATGLGARHGGSLVAALAAAGSAVFFAEARPHLASYVCFGLAIGAALRATTPSDMSAGRRALWVAVTFAVVALWANLHSVAPLGVLAIGVLAGGRTLRLLLATPRRTDLVVPTVAVGVVAALGVIATPFGLDPLRHASEVRAESQLTITEWFPLYRLGVTELPVVLFVVAVVVAGIGVVRYQAWRTVPEVVVFLVAFALLAVDANRNVAFFLLAISFSLPAAAALAPGSREQRVTDDRRRLLAVGSFALLAVSVVALAVTFGPLTRPADALPVAAVDALPSGCRLLNDRHVGGFVLWRRPDVPVSEDGRNDLFTADGFQTQTAWFEDQSPGDLGDLDRRGVTCVLFRDANPASVALEASGRWRRLPTTGPGSAYVRL